MKLVDILARELKEWPGNYADVGQADNGSLHLPGIGPHDRHTEETYTKAKDWFRSIVSRAQWQEAREALSKPAAPGAPMPPISEAPKDATHWDPGYKCEPTWACKMGGVWNWHPVDSAPIDSGWRVYPFQGEALESRLVAIDRPWSGEGLPPAGYVCENVFPGEIWREVIIVAHDGDMAVFRLNNPELLNYFGDTKQHFRPIRTPEQIAAEERNAILAEMQRAVDCGSHGPQITLQNTLMNLYDAGYRKVKDGNQTA